MTTAADVARQMAAAARTLLEALDDTQKATLTAITALTEPAARGLHEDPRARRICRKRGVVDFVREVQNGLS